MVATLLTAIDDVVNWWLGLPIWLWILIVLVASFLLGYILERIAVGILRRWSKRTRWEYDDALVDAMHPALAVILVWAFVSVFLRILPVRFSPDTIQLLDNAGVTIVVIATALGIARLVRGLLRVRAKHHPRWQRLSVTGSRVGAIVIYAVAFMVVIGQYGIEITPILTTMGIAGLAVALALQDTLANFFSGLWLQGQRSLQTGHYVRIEDSKLEGFVEDIGWRTTRIRTLPGNIIDVPNQTVAQSTIQDFWLPEPKMGTSITVVTGFEADPERVVPLMLEECMAAADEVSFILKEPAPAARLNRTVENGWEYWMSLWVPYYYNQWNAQGYVLNRIRKRFLKEGIRMPYPIRENYQVPEDRADLVDGVTAPQTPSATPGVLLAAVAEGHRREAGRGKIDASK